MTNMQRSTVSINYDSVWSSMITLRIIHISEILEIGDK